MAITFDNSAVFTTSTSFTVSGSNTILVVFSRYTSAPTYSYNGVGLTGGVTTPIGTGQTLQVFTLINPATGSNTLATSGGTSISSGALSYKGVKQSGQPKTSATNGGQTTADPSVAITIATTNSWGVVGLGSDNGDPISVSNWTRRDSDTQVVKGDSNGPLSSGSITFGAHYGSASAKTGIIAIEIEPFVAPGFLMFM